MIDSTLDLNRVHQGDCLDLLPLLPRHSVQCVVTSPPYWALRDYGNPPRVWGGQLDCEHVWGDHLPSKRGPGTSEKRRCNHDAQEVARTATRGQFCQTCLAWRGALGLEPSPKLFLRNMLTIFHEIWRVLTPDGTLWVNMGDGYAQKGSPLKPGELVKDAQRMRTRGYKTQAFGGYPGWNRSGATSGHGLKAKDLIGMPWRLAFALQRAGWYLRADCIWSKLNPLPSSVRDRPTVAHEYVFLLTKNPRYHYDAEAVRVPLSHAEKRTKRQLYNGKSQATSTFMPPNPAGHNLWTVWQFACQAFSELHTACVDTETECLTNRGWKNFEQLRSGDIAAQFDLEADLLSWAPIEELYSYQVSMMPMIAASTNNLDMLLTPNHRCVVRTQKRDWNIVQASHLTLMHLIPVAADWQAVNQADPCSSGFAELLGWYVAEGHEPKAGINRQRVHIYQSATANPEKVERITELLRSENATFNTHKRIRTWKDRPSEEITFSIFGEMAERLRSIAPAKCIPPSILEWPDHLIDSFLRGLFLGDGSRRRRDGRWTFIQKNKTQIDMAQALCVRLGLTSVLSLRKCGTYALHVSYRRTRGIRGPYGQNQILRIKYYTGTVWCPRLPLGTWVARRKGKVFITGNTFPEELPETCILAGTSERGACPHCGLQYQRQVEPTEAYRQRLGKSYHDHSDDLGRGQHAVPTAFNGAACRTIGWQKPCACPEAEPVPCVVLDPFMGSGTTGVVAAKLGRHVIGTELNPDYCALANERCDAARRGLTLKQSREWSEFERAAGGPTN